MSSLIDDSKKKDVKISLPPAKTAADEGGISLQKIKQA